MTPAAPNDKPVGEAHLRACAGEIRHGVEMLRHWQGNELATSAWLNHVDRYSRRLSEIVVASPVDESRDGQ